MRYYTTLGCRVKAFLGENAVGREEGEPRGARRSRGKKERRFRGEGGREEKALEREEGGLFEKEKVLKGISESFERPRGEETVDVRLLTEVAASLPAIRRTDPYLAREVARYGRTPLPSREFVVDQLTAAGRPLKVSELAALLEIRPFELEAFERRLAAMARDGTIVRNRQGAVLLPKKAALVAGRVQGHPDGFGFVVRDDGGPDIFLPPKEMRQVLHGDRVWVRVSGSDLRGRPEGRVVEVLERANRRVVGRVLVEHGVMLVVPEDRRIAQDILIAPGNEGGKRRVRTDDVVVAEIIEPPSRFAQPIGRIVEVLGRYEDPGMEIEIALRKHDLPFVWSRSAKEQVRRLPAAVRARDLRQREDLRSLPFVTIDGETAKDFDDAVFCEQVGKGFRLIVAIADVAHFVKADSALDDEAYARGTSVYFPRRVIPMLPERLSNDLCSLVPHEERLVMACEMRISGRGRIEQYRFFPAVIESRARLTYTMVAKALYEGDEEARELLGALMEPLTCLDRVFRALLSQRKRRGALDFDTPEVEFQFNEEGKIVGVRPTIRNDAHRLIEECMLAANVCASEFLATHEQPTLYRIHEPPDPEKVSKLREFLAGFGIALRGGENPKPKDFVRVLEQIADRPYATLLQMVMLRSLKQARYSPDNAGHFGLAYDCYTHFTSPIRRYPDLLVHRAVKAVLAGERFVPKRSWQEMGEHCSMTERRADEASRDVMNWLKCYYMQDRLGERFTGTISAVVPFGFFVTLDEVFVEGLVHISELGSDYFHYDEVRHALVGERTRVRYQLADRVEVEVARVDLALSRIDFRLIGLLRREGERGE
ncbi:MAG: ribonuclease R [Hydrogenophilus sp.]|nr:ribonuclease R [Hydrogenophilus sp.]